MKTTISALLILSALLESALLILAALLAFKSIDNTGNATVQRMQGLDVYVMSEPTRPYEVIKSVTAVQWLSCKEAVNTPVNKAAKEPGAQGVIIYWPVTSKYTIIKYKE
jgi:hypothetical protein